MYSNHKENFHLLPLYCKKFKTNLKSTPVPDMRTTVQVVN